MGQQRVVRLCVVFFGWAASVVADAGVSGYEVGQGFVRITDSGRLEMTQPVAKQVLETRTAERTVMKTVTKAVPYEVEANGKKETRLREVQQDVPTTETYAYTVCKMVYETILVSFAPGTNGFTREFDKAEIPVYDVAGNRLSVNSLEERLQDWTLVVISRTGKPLDKKLASVFRPGTIVIGVPPAAAPTAIPPMIGPAPAPAPVPAPVQILPAPAASAALAPADTTPVAFLAAEASAPQFPTTAAPGFAYAKVWGGKQLALRTETEASIATEYTVTRKVSTLVEGKSIAKEVPELKQVERIVQTQETVKFDLADVDVTRTPNRQYTRSDLPSVLANEVLAVVSRDGKEINPLWLRNLREGVFVVVCPQMPESGPVFSSPVMAAPAPVPTPAAPAAVPRVKAAVPQPALAPRPAPAPGT